MHCVQMTQIFWLFFYLYDLSKNLKKKLFFSQWFLVFRRGWWQTTPHHLTYIFDPATNRVKGFMLKKSGRDSYPISWFVGFALYCPWASNLLHVIRLVHMPCLKCNCLPYQNCVEETVEEGLDPDVVNQEKTLKSFTVRQQIQNVRHWYAQCNHNKLTVYF